MVMTLLYLIYRYCRKFFHLYVDFNVSLNLFQPFITISGYQESRWHVCNIQGCNRGSDRPKKGVTFGEKSQVLGVRNWENSQNFRGHKRKIFENWWKLEYFSKNCDFLEKWWLWSLKPSMYNWNSLKYLKNCQKSLISAHFGLF